jgi:hypothetical protein
LQTLLSVGSDLAFNNHIPPGVHTLNTNPWRKLPASSPADHTKTRLELMCTNRTQLDWVREHHSEYTRVVWNVLLCFSLQSIVNTTYVCGTVCAIGYTIC